MSCLKISLTNIEKYNLIIFTFLLLYSNIFSRILDLSIFNILLYVIGLIAVCINVMNNHKISYLKLLLYSLCLFFFTYSIIDFRSDFITNLLSLKDFCFPILCLLIGESMGKYKIDIVNLFNKLFLFFVTYGIIQEIAFYTNNLEVWLPWDYKIIIDFLESGDNGNLFQGGYYAFLGL